MRLDVTFRILCKKLLNSHCSHAKVRNSECRSFIPLFNTVVEPGVLLLVCLHWLVTVKSDHQGIRGPILRQLDDS